MNNVSWLSDKEYFIHSLQAFAEDLSNVLEELKEEMRMKKLVIKSSSFLRYTGDGDWTDFTKRRRRITFISRETRIHRTYSLSKLFSERFYSKILESEYRYLSQLIQMNMYNNYYIHLSEEGITLSHGKNSFIPLLSDFLFSEIPDCIFPIVGDSSDDELLDNSFENLSEPFSEKPFSNNHSKRRIVIEISDDE